MSVFFGYWCSNCPTRISIESERHDDPRYWREINPGLDMSSYACPGCGEKMLESLDDLLAYGEVPYEQEHGRRDEADRARRVRVRASEHAAFLEKRKKKRAKR